MTLRNYLLYIEFELHDFVKINYPVPNQPDISHLYIYDIQGIAVTVKSYYQTISIPQWDILYSSVYMLNQPRHCPINLDVLEAIWLSF